MEVNPLPAEDAVLRPPEGRSVRSAGHLSAAGCYVSCRHSQALQEPMTREESRSARLFGRVRQIEPFVTVGSAGVVQQNEPFRPVSLRRQRSWWVRSGVAGCGGGSNLTVSLPYGWHVAAEAARNCSPDKRRGTFDMAVS